MSLLSSAADTKAIIMVPIFVAGNKVQLESGKEQITESVTVTIIYRQLQFQ